MKESNKLLLGGTTFLLLIAIFFNLAQYVQAGQTSAWDEGLLQAISHAANNALASLFTLISHFGSWFFVLGFGAVLCGWCIRRHQSFDATFIATALVGGLFLNLGLKDSFERQRPLLQDGAIQLSSFSFPSGHAFASCTLALIIVYLTRHTKWRLIGCIGGALYVVLVGFSRLYLGVHYPSDILGGWIASAAWVLLVLGLFSLIRLSGRSAGS